jgi:hypothetical protein
MGRKWNWLRIMGSVRGLVLVVLNGYYGVSLWCGLIFCSYSSKICRRVVKRVGNNYKHELYRKMTETVHHLVGLAPCKFIAIFT